MKKSNYVGQKFNKLLALERIIKNRRSHYRCKCECGNEMLVEGNRLSSGHTKSCGCLRQEARKKYGHPLTEGLANGRVVIQYYKRNAKRRNISFELSEQESLDLLQGKCYYCGREPFNYVEKPRRNGRFIYSGMDRADNNKPYIKENVVPCCKDCNMMKRTRTIGEFYKIVSLIYHKHKGEMK